MKYDVIIAGAGAAGLMCAIEAGKRSRKVLLLDHAKAVAQKIRISGGGRCNFTNIHASSDNFLSSNPYFCVSALKRYTQSDFIKLVEKHGIAYHEKTLGQLFCDGSSQQIIDMLLDECAAVGVKVEVETGIKKIEKTDKGFKVDLSDGKSLNAESVVIATGGPSIPKMGATGWGYDIARQFGMKMIEPRAALVPLTVGGKLHENLQPLSGVSVEVVVSCEGTSFREGMLFTHRGLSGPSILQISSYWQEKKAVLINMAPDIDVLAKLKEFRTTNPKQELQKAVASFLPKSLAQYICSELKCQGNSADQSNEALQLISDAICAWEFVPSGTEGYRKAEVTLGGVDTDGLSSKTFEAKDVPGLYFIGEVVDVTGHLGGFNFQWAWSSGNACGKYV